MYFENELVKTKWNNASKKHYEGLGYIFTKKGEDLFVKAKEVPKTSATIIHIQCDYCGQDDYITKFKYYEKTDSFTKKYACNNHNCQIAKRDEYINNPIRAVSYSKYLRYCKEKGFIPISTDYKNYDSKIEILCPKHGRKTTTLEILEKGCGCNECATEYAAKRLRKSTSEIIDIVKSKNNDELLNPEDYKNVRTNNLKIRCGSCDSIFITSLASIMVSEGMCKECAIRHVTNYHRLSSKEVSKIISRHNGNKLLNPDEYINNATKNLQIQCSCGEVYLSNLSNYINSTVKKCFKCWQKASTGELLIIDILQKQNIEFEREKKFADCKDKKYLPFDFYLPKYNMCIEFDGQLHYKNRYGEETLKNVQKHDKMKDEYCKNNNIKLVRIPYWNSRQAEDIILQNIS